MSDDFSEIERELKKLQPSAASVEFLSRLEQTMLRTHQLPSAGVVKRRAGLRLKWLSLGLGCAAAAALFCLARLEVQTANPTIAPIALVSAIPRLESPAPLVADSRFVPAGLTQVVYHTRDEGLVFPANSPQPMRRLRRQGRETLQWRNPSTGASIRVSYDAEQVELLPVSGQ
ncbi:MAG: hypothetical protein ABI839_06515 [Verrucomicrobiota bacterium]